jgi:hypothetical protein
MRSVTVTPPRTSNLRPMLILMMILSRTLDSLAPEDILLELKLVEDHLLREELISIREINLVMKLLMVIQLKIKNSRMTMIIMITS